MEPDGRQPTGPSSSGGRRSPIGTTAAIAIAVVALVAGFLIIRSVSSDDDNSSDSATTEPGSETIPDGSSVITLDPSTTVAPVGEITTTSAAVAPVTEVVEGAIIVVANASTVDGAAGALTDGLKIKKFTTTAAVTATLKQNETQVLYAAADPAAVAVATYLSSVLGGAKLGELTAPAPVEGGSLPEGATILVMLGSDKAAMTIEQMNVPSTSVAATSTTVAAASTDSTTTTVAAP